MSASVRQQSVNFDRIASLALSQAPHLLTQWFPAGRVRGHEFCIGNLRGDPGKSLRVNLQTGQWADFAGSSDERGGDLISLFAALHGMKQVDAARALAMELGADAASPAGAKVVALPEWRAIMPVPADAPSPPAEHFRLGTPSHIAEVRGVDGALLHYIYRFDPNGRRKEVLPLTYGVMKGKRGWYWKAPPEPRPLYGLDRLAAWPNAPVLIVEGEPKRDAAERMLGGRMVVVSWPNGADGVAHVDLDPLRGREAQIWPDADPIGGKAAKRMAARLRGVVASVAIVPIPEGKDDGWDLADAEREGWTGARVLEHLARAAEVPCNADDMSEDGRPTIRIEGGAISDEVDAAEAALIAAGSGIYQRGHLLVRTGTVRIEVTDGREAEGLRILEVDEHCLREAMTRAAVWLKRDTRTRDGHRQVNAPMEVVETYRSRVGRWGLPVLAGVVTAPTLRRDGSVLDTPGYDAATGLLFDPCGASFPPIPRNPSKADAEMALAELEALIGTFPFVSKADEAVAISNILTATIRRSLRTTPLHGFSAPAAGSGKTKLVDIASVIANGREAGVIAQGADDAETEKRLVGLLLGGETVVAIDNCENPVGGDFLCQVLTQTRVQARILGASKIVELPTGALVTATGNNLTIYGDMTRRSVVCNLDPRCERPELRHFDSEPVQDAKVRRGRYLVAALTVLRAYRLAPEGGRGPEPKPIGSFEEWSAWVRNALLWLGRGDPAATMEATRRQDPVLLNLSTLIEQWWHAIGPETITVKNAIAFAAGNEELRDAMLAVAGQRGEIQPLVLGKYLGKIEGRVVGGRRMVKDGMQQGSQKWKLEAIERVVAGA